MTRTVRRSGFTLVELLVVIIIIAILAAILIPAVNAARQTARKARVTLEMTQIATALDAYKDKNGGDYPADFSDFQLSAPNTAQDFKDHLARAFPRYVRPTVVTWLATTPASQRPSNLDPAEAIPFWLGLVRDDVKFPVSAPNGSNVPLTIGSGRTPLFDFDQTRLRDRDGDGWLEYYPQGVDDAPYVYFDHSTYLIASYPSPAPATSTIGVARPFQSSGAWLEPNRFQIVTAGFDNDFGIDTVANPPNAFKQVPSQAQPEGLRLGQADRDNLTSFSGGKTIEELRP